jgi:predicted O-linked N-acetylglucosamine transferase (SPINDLY family)
MGVPVVTRAGDSHVSRVGVSLLQAVGLSDWIARDDDDYIRIAVTAAGDVVKLGELRTALRGKMRSSALLDHSAQASRFGNALRTVWQNWCAAKNSSAAAVQPELATL